MSNATYTYEDESYSDLHKDAFGFRPGSRDWARWSAMSDDAKQAEWDSLVEVMKRRMDEEKEMEQECIARFEANVAGVIAAGAKDRETAIRWIIDAEDVDGDLDHFCYRMGLPYGYFATAKEAA